LLSVICSDGSVIEVTVAITVRGLEESTRLRLKQLAASHDGSMEAEVRNIIERATTPDQMAAAAGEGSGLGTALHRIAARFGVDPEGAFDHVRSDEQAASNEAELSVVVSPREVAADPLTGFPQADFGRRLTAADVDRLIDEDE
jgi:plasmid stability protein